MARIAKSMDGNNAAAYVSYAFTEVAGIYPITPSSPMADYVDQWSAKGMKNIFGTTVKVAEMEVQRYDYVKRQTWGGLLPQVSVTGQVNHSFIVQQMSKGFSLGNDPYTTLSGAVDASVPLFAPQVYRMMKMNDKQMATAVEAARSSRITLTAEVKKAFYNILLAEQSLDVLRESEATVQRTVDDTQVQYQNGLTSEYDLLTAQVQLSNLKPSILQTENSIRIAKLMLKMYLSIPEQVEIEVEGELDAMLSLIHI